jgi:hypothetical protein
MTVSDALRPGLAKTRGERLVRSQVVALVRVSDGRLRAMFDAADVVSEGSVRSDRDVSVWYGTTSLILPWPQGLSVSRARDFFACIAAKDPHVRLRAVRTAHREATLRAPGSLGRAECEVRVAAREDGLWIDVDVQAPLTLLTHTAHDRARARTDQKRPAG